MFPNSRLHCVQLGLSKRNGNPVVQERLLVQDLEPLRNTSPGPHLGRLCTTCTTGTTGTTGTTRQVRPGISLVPAAAAAPAAKEPGSCVQDLQEACF